MKLVIDIDEEELNRIRHFCSFGCDNIPLGWYEIAKSKPLQTELEKIKAEITACTQQEEGEVPACINYGIKLSTEIVEKHISELKGEINGN